ncbi:hypothetical protein CVT25_015155 [Psilocybe cyanescens]|uniref:Uncharacterized protein n=1 Tax=Psilocybe cyanescens TaxID=93625 RepID=A0A409W5P0_PSICY|nr:hypothetical protein CVT25_015155 [Psilocybe cyanescens]
MKSLPVAILLDISSRVSFRRIAHSANNASITTFFSRVTLASLRRSRDRFHRRFYQWRSNIDIWIWTSERRRLRTELTFPPERFDIDCDSLMIDEAEDEDLSLKRCTNG